MRARRLASLMGMLLCLSFAAAAAAAPANDIAIIPRPQQVQPSEGRFQLSAGTSILAQSGQPAAADAAAIVGQTLSGAAGLKLQIGPSDLDQPPDGAILLTTRGADASLGEEGYELQVTPHGALIRAPGGAGLFYGADAAAASAAGGVWHSTGHRC